MSRLTTTARVRLQKKRNKERKYSAIFWRTDRTYSLLFQFDVVPNRFFIVSFRPSPSITKLPHVDTYYETPRVYRS